MDFLELLFSVILASLCAAATSFYWKSQLQQQQIDSLQKQIPSETIKPATKPSASDDEIANLLSKNAELQSKIDALEVRQTIHS
jgi:hypothetical protein